MQGQLPTAQARPLSETIGTSDVEKMLREYVEPAFLKLNDANKQKAIDAINKMVSDQDEDD